MDGLDPLIVAGSCVFYKLWPGFLAIMLTWGYWTWWWEAKGSKGLGYNDSLPSAGYSIKLGWVFSLSVAILNIHYGWTGSSSISKVRLSLLLCFLLTYSLDSLVDMILDLSPPLIELSILLIDSLTLVTYIPFSI